MTAAAAAAAWLPFAIWLMLGMGAEFGVALIALPYSFLGCAVVGLPISLILFRNLDRLNLTKLLAIANLAGALFVLFTFALGSVDTAIVFGVPCVIAANAFALFGWLLIVRSDCTTTSD